MIRFVYLLLFLVIIVSCKKEVVGREEPWECLPCSHYYGSYSGNIQSPMTGVDTSFMNIPTILEITEGLNDSINLSFDVSGFMGSPQGTHYINFDQAYWKDSTITGQSASDLSQFPTFFDLAATNSYKYQLIQGTITFSGASTGVLTFEAIR